MFLICWNKIRRLNAGRFSILNAYIGMSWARGELTVLACAGLRDEV